MSVYRKRNSPYFHFDFRIRGRRFHGSTGATARGEAKAVERLERRRARRGLAGEAPPAPALTLAGACELYWLEVADGQGSAATTDYQLARLCTALGRTAPVPSIGDAEVASYVAARRGETTKRGAPPAPATINREIELLRRVLYRAAAVHRQRVQDIDWRRHRRREPDRRQRILRRDEEARLMAAAAPHLRPAIAFSLLAGVRLANAIGLDWSQIDWAARSITFRVKSARHDGGKVLELPLTDAMAAVLAPLRRRGDGAAGETGRVFLWRGRPMRTWKTAWRAALRRAGIAGLRWHDLRHTFGHRLDMADVNLTLIRDIMGHESIATTMRYRADRADRRAALDRIAPAPAAALERGENGEPDSRTIPEPAAPAPAKSLKSQ